MKTASELRPHERAAMLSALRRGDRNRRLEIRISLVAGRLERARVLAAIREAEAAHASVRER